MRLIRLGLLNFRQHADTRIEFRKGLTGIIGPNGAGKSTILEAIAWAIYGSPAARGTNDTIRFSRAPGRSRVQVELTFELAGHEYRVVRSMHNAEVFLDGGAAPVAATLGGVTEYLQRRLGMSREEFFNTYFTGQKELQFLAQMGSAQRGRFLGQVLGYERLRLAQERARARRNELRHEIEGLRAGLPDPEALKGEREAAERRRAEATAALRDARAAAEEAEARRAALLPAWEAAQRAREQAREIAHGLDVARREREVAERDRARAVAELDRIAEAAAELAPLREALAELPTVAEECATLAELARLDERRRVLLENEKTLAAELEEGRRRLEKLEEAPRYLEQYRAELAEARRRLATAEQAVEAAHRDWVQRREEARTKLEAYRERARELKEQVRQLEQAGPDGTCPTCGRPLGAQFDAVVGRLRDEWDALVQDGKWLKSRLDQLQAKPDELAAAERERADANRAIEEASQRLARCERAVDELERLRADQAGRAERLDRIRAELAGMPAEYDRERHRRAEARLEELRQLERRASRLEQTVEARAAREIERDEADARARRAADRIASLERRQNELRFSEEEFLRLRDEYDAAADAVRRAELRVTELRGLLAAAEEALETATRAEAAYQERRAALAGLEIEQRHHNELDAALSQLRAELNARVRPELGQLASAFLAEITDGRYTSLEIDENYNVLVLDEGEEKPVISGGEEDIANLVLRLAISQMIAERAGHPLSVLILDEVFGSLDIERRDNVIQLLHRLGDRFEQVILITHIESIREGLDQVIRVEYDERTGASIVRDESIEEAASAGEAVGTAGIEHSRAGDGRAAD
ncbi:MAG TPA: SMC family ATPase [Longimicrobiales bacterium]